MEFFIYVELEVEPGSPFLLWYRPKMMAVALPQQIHTSISFMALALLHWSTVLKQKCHSESETFNFAEAMRLPVLNV